MPQNSLSPRATARLAGLVFAIGGLSAVFVEMFVRGRLVVGGDPARTAANILASEGLYRVGGVIDVASLATDVVLAVLLYRLLRPVSRDLALLMGSLRMAFAVAEGLNTVNHFAPLYVLKSAAFAASFVPAQREALAMSFLRMHSTGFNIALIFFGLHLVLLGAMMAASGYFPRLLGALVGLAGAAYLANSTVYLLGIVFPGSAYILTGAIGELALLLWLLAVGLDEKRWRLSAS